MRKLLINHFVLDFFINLFGTRYNFPRASRIIMPVFILTGWLHMDPSTISWIMIGVTCLLMYFGFVHFKLWPPKFYELDDQQKFQYGLLQPNKLTPLQYKEWVKITEKLNLK